MPALVESARHHWVAEQCQKEKPSITLRRDTGSKQCNYGHGRARVVLAFFSVGVCIFNIFYWSFSLASIPSTGERVERMALRGRDEAHHPLDSDASAWRSQDVNSNNKTQNDCLFSEESAVVANRTFLYRYPQSFGDLGSRRSSGGSNHDEIIVVGVLSSPTNVRRREHIRRTWASDAAGDHVFFVVGGNWTAALADEFEAHCDIVWMDSPEGYRNIGYKTNLFFHAVHTQVASYNYVLKTDDDSYVYLEKVQQILLKSTRPKRDYWGSCLKNSEIVTDPTDRWYMPKELYPQNYRYYPPYATGGGYALSRELNSCVVTHIANHAFLPIEDVWTGLMAKRCGVACQHNDMLESKAIMFNIYSKDDEARMQKKMAEMEDEFHVSCSGPLCSTLMAS